MIPKNVPTKKIKLTSEKGLLEKDIEGKNRVYAKSKGVMFDKFVSEGKRSVPDRMLTFPNGLIVFIEYKAPGKRATEKQWQDHCRRRAFNVLVYVIDDIDAGVWLIDKLIDLDINQENFYNEMESNKANYVNQKSITSISE